MSEICVGVGFCVREAVRVDLGVAEGIGLGVADGIGLEEMVGATVGVAICPDIGVAEGIGPMSVGGT